MKRITAVFLIILLSFSVFLIQISATESKAISSTIPNGDVAAGTIVKLVPDNADCDIWYTVDGSDPTNSETAYLYSEEKGIIVTETLTVKALAKSEKTGISKISEFKYTCSKPLVVEDELWPKASISYAVSLDKENKKVGENSIKIVGGGGRYISTGEMAIDSDFDYKLGFWLKTERLGIETSVDFKVFLSGEGSERHPQNPQVTGATLGNYGKSFFDIKDNMDWTYYEVDINNMNGRTKALTLILQNNSASGLVWIDGVTLTASQKAYYPINVESDGSVYSNLYNQKLSDDFVIEQGITINNVAKNLEKGTLNYNVVNDADPSLVIQKGKINIKADKSSKINKKIKLDKVNKYGTFTINFTVKNSSGAVYNAGSVKLSRFIDNTYLLENGGTFLGACGAIDNDNTAKMSNYLGNSIYRFDYDWTDVEKEKGVYTIHEMKDGWINTMVENNIEPMLIFNTHGWPEWMEEKGWPTTESDLEHFLGYVKFLVETYKGKVKYFEFYNEVNYRKWVSPDEYPDAVGYTETMKEVYKVLKEANPDAILLGGSTSDFAHDWARTMFENGAADCMDYYSFHPYSQKVSPETADWKGAMDRLNDTIVEVTGEPFPLFITEVGYATARSIERGFSYQDQMTYLTRLCTMAKSVENLEKVVTYCISSGESYYYTENQYGMLAAGGYAKPLAVARAAFNHMHNGFEFDSIEEIAENLFAYKFSGEKEDMYVLWTDDIECYADIVTSDTSAKVYDIFGNDLNAKYNQNEFKAEIGSKVTYVRLKKGETIESVSLKVKADLTEEEISAYTEYFKSKNVNFKLLGFVAGLILGIAIAITAYLIVKRKKKSVN